MNSEKVKEIKNVLNTWKITFHGITNADILTYINELESENERLILQYERVKADSEMNCLELKDQISELEKVYDRQVRIINDLNIEVVKEQKKLSKFAERLKEKLEEYRLENEYFTEHEPNGNLWQMNASVFCIEVIQDCGLVDETLKEFINKGGVVMEGYQIYYEYNDNNGRFVKVQECRVYNDYNKAESELSDVLSDLEMRGYTNVQGDIKEVK
jgi:uncharacterized coiled-coil protein SlyX